MEISIEQLKRVAEGWRQAEQSYQKQLRAFDDILHTYRSMAQDRSDRKAMQKLRERMEQEYHQLRQFREVLTEIIRQYETTEKTILRVEMPPKKRAPVIRRIDTEPAKKILEQYNIRIR